MRPDSFCLLTSVATTWIPDYVQKAPMSQSTTFKMVHRHWAIAVCLEHFNPKIHCFHLVYNKWVVANSWCALYIWWQDKLIMEKHDGYLQSLQMLAVLSGCTWHDRLQGSVDPRGSFCSMCRFLWIAISLQNTCSSRQGCWALLPTHWAGSTAHLHDEVIISARQHFSLQRKERGPANRVQVGLLIRSRGKMNHK